jgi:DNA-binding response OmpR family regulator
MTMVRLLRSDAHIVVADARPKDYRDLALLAGENGWHLHFFTTGLAAIRHGRPSSSDLWIVNAHLPDMDGFDLLEIVSAQVAKSSIFIVADRYESEDERRACQCGAALYLCKDATHAIDFKQLVQLATEKRAAHVLNSPVS